MLNPDTPPPHLNLSRSSKLSLNKMILQELKYHYKKSVPVNSSKSIKVLNSVCDGDFEIPAKYINSKAFHSKNSSIDKYIPKENSRTCNNSALRYNKARNVSNHDQHCLAETQREIKSTSRNLLEKSTTSPILKKHLKLFELILNRDVNKERDQIRINEIIKIKPRSSLKLDVEKVLHEEYIKDRVKFKLGNSRYYKQKKIWKPDSMKTLKKADKVIFSLPRTRDL